MASATIQAPPVPCRLTGVPAWRATAPSWATAAPEPRATARARPGLAKRAQPAARWAVVDQGHGPLREPRVAQRRAQRQGVDRPRRAQGVAPDAHHRRVPRTQDAGGVGEDVGAPLEDEADHTHPADHLLHPPALVGHRLQRRLPPGGEVAPEAEALDHLRPHRLAGLQAGSGAPPGAGLRDVLGVGRADLLPDGVLRQGRGEGLVEGVDLRVREDGQGAEGLAGPAHRPIDRAVDRARDVQDVARVLHHHQIVAGPEGVCDFVRDGSDSVPAVEEGHPPGHGIQGAHALMLPRLFRLTQVRRRIFSRVDP